MKDTSEAEERNQVNEMALVNRSNQYELPSPKLSLNSHNNLSM